LAGLAALLGPAASSALPLGDVLAANGRVAGAATLLAPFAGDPLYKATLLREYDMIVPSNELKWPTTQGQRGVYNYAQPDAMIVPARAAGMQVRGHTLVWHNAIPKWLADGTWSRQELLDILHDHILNVVGHYRGQIAQWDVVNEIFDSGGRWRNAESIWYRTIGPEFVDLAFKWAHEADPDAKLFLNDYNTEGLGAKSDAVYNLAADLKSRGVPIDGIGFQSHFTVDTPPVADMVANMDRLAALGLEVAITEMDIRLPITRIAQGVYLPPSAAALEQQHDAYERVASACAARAACKTFVTFGFTDRYSWIPETPEFIGEGAALPFDENYRPKPAYYGIREGFGERPGQAALREAETADADPDSGNAADASWMLKRNGCVRSAVAVTTRREVVVSFVGRGTFFGGAWPRAEIQLDGRSVGTVDVAGGSWGTYRASAGTLSRGTHTMAVCFVNDYAGPDGDRNLAVDKLTLGSTVSASQMFQRSGGSATTAGWSTPAGATLVDPVDVDQAGLYQVLVTARATGAAADVSIAVDGTPVSATQTVASPLWQEYSFDVPFAPGRHDVSIRVDSPLNGPVSSPVEFGSMLYAGRPNPAP
jgi:endo-1,4-beta-xylanase